MKHSSAIKFSSAKADFFSTLNQRVNEYFKTNNISRYANNQMRFKTAFMFTLYLAPYFLMITGIIANPWVMLAMCLLMGTGIAGIGLAVMHDANHGSYSNKSWINNMIGYSLNVMGAGAFNCKVQHNVLHHTYTNIQGIDEDLEVSPLLRLSPESQHKPIHRFQHYYALAAYSMSTLFWVFVKDYKYAMQRDLGPYENIKHPRSQIAILLGYATFMLGICLLACVVPTRRALNVEPTVALRMD